MRPAPPEALSWSWLQPREPCEEFHDFMCQVSFRPERSWCPTIAEPSPLFAQLPQVVSPPAVEKRPDGSEPVRMSCSFGCSPRPLIGSPFSDSAVCLLMFALSECRSSRFFATTTPLALRHGPLPMRSRAFTPASPPGSQVLKYAFQFTCFEPALFASALQCASAPSSPPRSAPLPLPALVTKNVMSCACAAPAAKAKAAVMMMVPFMSAPLVELRDGEQSVAAG